MSSPALCNSCLAVAPDGMAGDYQDCVECGAVADRALCDCPSCAALARFLTTQGDIGFLPHPWPIDDRPAILPGAA